MSQNSRTQFKEAYENQEHKWNGKWKGKWKKKLREGMVRMITPLGVWRPPR